MNLCTCTLVYVPIGSIIMHIHHTHIELRMLERMRRMEAAIERFTALISTITPAPALTQAATALPLPYPAPALTQATTPLLPAPVLTQATTPLPPAHPAPALTQATTPLPPAHPAPALTQAMMGTVINTRHLSDQCITYAQAAMSCCELRLVPHHALHVTSIIMTCSRRE